MERSRMKGFADVFKEFLQNAGVKLAKKRLSEILNVDPKD